MPNSSPPPKRRSSKPEEDVDNQTDPPPPRRPASAGNVSPPSSPNSFPLVDFLSKVRRTVLRSPKSLRSTRGQDTPVSVRSSSSSGAPSPSLGAVRRRPTPNMDGDRKRRKRKKNGRRKDEVDDAPQSPLLENRVSMRSNTDDDEDYDEEEFDFPVVEGGGLRTQQLVIPLASVDDCTISVISGTNNHNDSPRSMRSSMSSGRGSNNKRSRLRRLCRWSSKQIRRAVEFGGGGPGGRGTPPIVVTMTDGIATIHTSEEMKEKRKRQKRWK